MPLRPFACSFVILLALPCAAQAGNTPPRPATLAGGLELRLVHLLDGLRGEAPGGDLAKIGDARIGKEAAKVDLDLGKLPHPLVAHGFAHGRFFYLFYKDVDGAFGDRPYVIQRIKKTERSWAVGATEPTATVTWMVEVFKTTGGQLKGGCDQHFGSFALGGNERREIEKEYEIGFGEIPGLCAGTQWPLDPNKLAVVLQPYAEQAGVYERIQFTQSKRWRLVASFGKGGGSLVAPELGIDTGKGQPPPARIAVVPAPGSREVVLVAGKGPGELAIGSSDVAALKQALGEPLEDVAVGQGHRNLSFGCGLTANVDAAGLLNTVFTRPAFGGRTKEGIALGMPRAEVKKLLGLPKGSGETAPRWSYPGLIVVFDGFDAVQKLVVAKG